MGFPICSICARSDEPAITAALHAKGATIQAVAREWPWLSYSSLKRHRRDQHRFPPPADVADDASRRAAQSDGDSPEQMAVTARRHFMTEFLAASGKGDAKAAVGFGNLILTANEQLASTQGSFERGGPTINVGVAVGGGAASENVPVVLAILRAFTPHPEARTAVLATLSRFDGMTTGGNGMERIEDAGGR